MTYRAASVAGVIRTVRHRTLPTNGAKRTSWDLLDRGSPDDQR